jgi:hypothetical protein
VIIILIYFIIFKPKLQMYFRGEERRKKTLAFYRELCYNAVKNYARRNAISPKGAATRAYGK